MTYDLRLDAAGGEEFFRTTGAADWLFCDPADPRWRAYAAWRAAGGAPTIVGAAAETPRQTIAWMDFVGLFTPAELAAIATSADPSVAVFRLMATGLGGDMQLDDPRVAAGLDALTAAGLIAAGRKAQILAREAPRAAA